MLEIEINKKALIHAFATLSTTISYENMQSFFDMNHSMESALTTLLNKLFELSLINLNTVKHNYPAIDLGDIASGIAVQVTSNSSNSKFNKTLDLYVKNNLNSEYKEVWFLIISNATKGTFQRTGFDIKVMNLGDLAKLICEKDERTFNELFEYCKKQFANYFLDADNTNPLAKRIIPSQDPPKDISNFVNAIHFKNDIDFQNELREGLLSLKCALAKMSDGERMFIYKVLSESPECTDIHGHFLPWAVMIVGLNRRDVEVVDNIFISLESKKIAWIDNHRHDLAIKNVRVGFNSSIENFDYLSAIRKNLKGKGQESALESVILKCDFSCIG